MSIHGPVVINLDKRTDRLEQMTKEFSRLGLEFIRLSATEDTDEPALACIDSHCRALEDFLITDSEVAFICEDDAEFKCSRADIDHYLVEFISSPADVMCFGYYASQEITYTALLYSSNDIQNRVSYIVKRKAATEILKVWRKLYVLLATKEHIKTPDNWYSRSYNNLPIINRAKDIYRGDQAWKICQQNLLFVLPKKRMVVQRESYSDIEKCKVLYGH